MSCKHFEYRRRLGCLYVRTPFNTSILFYFLIDNIYLILKSLLITTKNCILRPKLRMLTFSL